MHPGTRKTEMGTERGGQYLWDPAADIIGFDIVGRWAMGAGGQGKPLFLSSRGAQPHLEGGVSSGQEVDETQRWW